MEFALESLRNQTIKSKQIQEELGKWTNHWMKESGRLDMPSLVINHIHNVNLSRLIF